MLLPFVETILRGLVCEKNLGARTQLNMVRRLKDGTLLSWPTVLCSYNLEQLET
jgi:hypothetical protein